MDLNCLLETNEQFLDFCLDVYPDDQDSISPRDIPSSMIGGGRGSRGSHLDPENEITRNRDFYRAHDVRPPFTYAALIRQVILNLDR